MDWGRLSTGIPGVEPDRLEMAWRPLGIGVLELALALSGVAERQQGQHHQLDVRLAVARCLRFAENVLRSDQRLVPEQQFWKLAVVASRVMATFAAAPEAASAASVLMPRISDLLCMNSGSSMPGSTAQLVGVGRSLFASAKLLLEGPNQLLTTAGVIAHGPVLINEAATSIFSAIVIAATVSGAALAGEHGISARLMQQCQLLLTDPTIAARLQACQPYPLCVWRVRPPAANLAILADCAAHMAVNHMAGLFDANFPRFFFVHFMAAGQQQILAVSAAVAQPGFMYGPEVGLPEEFDRPPAAIYNGAALLADISAISAATLQDDPAAICKPAGLAATGAAGAVAALPFAPLDSSCGRRPAGFASRMPGPMQYAAQAAKYVHLLAQQLGKSNSANAVAARVALTTQGATQSLVRLLLWLSEPTTAVATASGVLAKALPALQLMAAGGDICQVLAAPGGPHNWELVAAALRRRLPRRMAARFLPDVDRVSAAVARRTRNVAGSVKADTAAVAAAEAAMAELLQVCATIC